MRASKSWPISREAGSVPKKSDLWAGSGAGRVIIPLVMQNGKPEKFPSNVQNISNMWQVRPQSTTPYISLQFLSFYPIHVLLSCHLEVQFSFISVFASTPGPCYPCIIHPFYPAVWTAFCSSGSVLPFIHQHEVKQLLNNLGSWQAVRKQDPFLPRGKKNFLQKRGLCFASHGWCYWCEGSITLCAKPLELVSDCSSPWGISTWCIR